MSLREKQSEFMQALGKLIEFAYAQGYELTGGDLAAKAGHKDGSFHYKRLAIDLNLFRDGRWLTSTEDHALLGHYWEGLGGTWGGRFNDGNHYSWGE
jgi:hypothetical protein